jgi:ribosome-associated translation inhibitor RaiA
MTQLTQLENLEQTIQEPYSQENMQTDSEVPAIDYAWVKQSINRFLEEQKLPSSLKDISVYFTEQPVKKNIIRCDIHVKMNNKTITITGQGMDEYQAVEDVLQNLELEVLLESAIQKSKHNFFFSNSINQFQRGGQYA